jgi:hypothetical protein
MLLAGSRAGPLPQLGSVGARALCWQAHISLSCAPCLPRATTLHLSLRCLMLARVYLPNHPGPAAAAKPTTTTRRSGGRCSRRPSSSWSYCPRSASAWAGTRRTAPRCSRCAAAGCWACRGAVRGGRGGALLGRAALEVGLSVCCLATATSRLIAWCPGMPVLLHVAVRRAGAPGRARPVEGPSRLQVRVRRGTPRYTDLGDEWQQRRAQACSMKLH